MVTIYMTHAWQQRRAVLHLMAGHISPSAQYTRIQQVFFCVFAFEELAASSVLTELSKLSPLVNSSAEGMCATAESLRSCGIFLISHAVSTHIHGAAG